MGAREGEGAVRRSRAGTGSAASVGSHVSLHSVADPAGVSSRSSRVKKVGHGDEEGEGEAAAEDDDEDDDEEAAAERRRRARSHSALSGTGGLVGSSWSASWSAPSGGSSAGHGAPLLPLVPFVCRTLEKSADGVGRLVRAFEARRALSPTGRLSEAARAVAVDVFGAALDGVCAHEDFGWGRPLLALMQSLHSVEPTRRDGSGDGSVGDGGDGGDGDDDREPEPRSYVFAALRGHRLWRQSSFWESVLFDAFEVEGHSRAARRGEAGASVHADHDGRGVDGSGAEDEAAEAREERRLVALENHVHVMARLGVPDGVGLAVVSKFASVLRLGEAARVRLAAAWTAAAADALATLGPVPPPSAASAIGGGGGDGLDESGSGVGASERRRGETTDSVGFLG